MGRDCGVFEEIVDFFLQLSRRRWRGIAQSWLVLYCNYDGDCGINGFCEMGELKIFNYYVIIPI